MIDPNLIYRPHIIDIRIPSDKELFEKIFLGSIVIDNIIGQLKELVKLQNPKLKPTAEQSDKLITKHLNGTLPENYGLWIYYPWSNKLVHTVFEKEFIELRTIRNKYKITHEEQALLYSKKIGIVGLSVGHAIAITVASERICNELRLADFDELELSNLNRIKTGIQNLGMKKTIICAREIAEIDPFVNVICYHDGIKDENIIDFLTKGGKIDVCIEECDSFYEKFNVRYKCRELQIPVVMDTSDKGLIDIERFDLEPDRKIFHGLTDIDDINKLRNLTPEQKIPYLYQIVNEETMSTRLRASLIEIEETITGWPQLSSAVTFGSGMTTDVVRRILLDQFKSSGRYSIDIENLIKDIEVKEQETIVSETTNDINIDAIITPGDNASTIIEKSIIEKIVSDAITAPSGGNAQPWQWVSSGNTLLLYLNKTRCSPYTDLNDWAAIMALGSATENLILSAYHEGYGVKKELLNLENHEFAVKFIFTTKDIAGTETIYHPTHYDSIKIRQSNRNNSSLTLLKPEHQEGLLHAVESIPTAKLTLIENRDAIIKIADIIAEADIIRFLNKFLFNEMMSEIRWDRKEALERPYGIELDLFDITAKERIGFKIANSWSVASFVKKIGGNALGDMSRKQLLASSAVGLITMPQLNSSNFYNGGLALERFWLSATESKLAVHPFVALCYFFMRVETNTVSFFSKQEIETLKDLRKRWRDVLGTPEGAAEIFFCKLSYAPPAAMSQRIPLEEVLVFK